MGKEEETRTNYLHHLFKVKKRKCGMKENGNTIWALFCSFSLPLNCFNHFFFFLFNLHVPTISILIFLQPFQSKAQLFQYIVLFLSAFLSGFTVISSLVSITHEFLPFTFHIFLSQLGLATLPYSPSNSILFCLSHLYLCLSCISHLVAGSASETVMCCSFLLQSTQLRTVRVRNAL